MNDFSKIEWEMVEFAPRVVGIFARQPDQEWHKLVAGIDKAGKLVRYPRATVPGLSCDARGRLNEVT